jgi:hypothetical protein
VALTGAGRSRCRWATRHAFHERRLRVSPVIEPSIAEFAPQPGFYDELVLVDSAAVECARSLETTRRSQLGDAADYGHCAIAAVSS